MILILKYSARIGDYYYQTLKEALDAVNADAGNPNVEFFGTAELDTDAVINQNVTFNVTSAGSLNIAAGVTLTNLGTIVNSGMITNSGEIDNQGIFNRTITYYGNGSTGGRCRPWIAKTTTKHLRLLPKERLFRPEIIFCVGTLQRTDPELLMCLALLSPTFSIT
jgi:hypothetical protein